jgi:hypothetical protein
LGFDSGRIQDQHSQELELPELLEYRQDSLALEQRLSQYFLGRSFQTALKRLWQSARKRLWPAPPKQSWLALRLPQE